MKLLWASAVKLLSPCRPAFKNKITFYWFFWIVISFCFRGGKDGVTSLCRALSLPASCYTAMLNFFKSKAVNLKKLRQIWFNIIYKAFEKQLYRIQNRIVIVLDEIKFGKEGLKMPGVRSLYQSSQDNSKPSFIMGHRALVIGLIVSAFKSSRVIPFFSQILEGLCTGGKNSKSLIDKTVERIVDICQSIADKPIIVADAFYAVRSFMKPLAALGIDVISRIRNNAVAYYFPESSDNTKPGRPKKYGMKVKLIEIFNQLNLFSTVQSPIPGENLTIAYYALTLMTRWLNFPVMFVFVQHPTRGKIILISTNTSFPPLEVYLTYYHRFQIEVAFKQLKHIIYAFSYRFWTFALTCIKRGDKNQYIHRQTPQEKESILSTFNAYHVFMQLALMAFGVLQYLAIFHSEEVYASFSSWLRTIRPGLVPSIEIASNALQQQGKYFFDSQEIPDEMANFLLKKQEKLTISSTPDDCEGLGFG